MKTLKKAGIFFLMIVLALIITACGGGSGGSSDDTSIEEETPEDVVPPIATLPEMEFPPTMPFLNSPLSRQLSAGYQLISIPTIGTLFPAFFLNNWPSIEMIWKWDQPSSTWQAFPEQEGYETFTEMDPLEGYWVHVSSALELSGNGPDSADYIFGEGWNMIGYSHSASTISSETFVNGGDFWQPTCNNRNPVISIWAWQNNTWQIYFTGDTFEDPVMLNAFNQTHQTTYEVLREIEPGMGLWVNAFSNQPLSNGESCIGAFEDDSDSNSEDDASQEDNNSPDPSDTQEDDTNTPDSSDTQEDDTNTPDSSDTQEEDNTPDSSDTQEEDNNIPESSDSEEEESNPNLPIAFADPNFETCVRDHLNLDASPPILPEMVLAITNLECSQRNITDMSGVEFLTSLKSIYAGYNPIESLDLRGLTELESLDMSESQLSSLNVSGLTKLKTLHLYKNQLTTLDVSELTELTALGVQNNQLRTLDLSALSHLQELYAGDNRLIFIDVTNLAELSWAYFDNNPLHSIGDLSGFTELNFYVSETYVSCDSLNASPALSSRVAISGCTDRSTIYVDSSYTGNESGTIDQPYRTISAALAVSQAADQILVTPGLYQENIQLKAGVELISERTGAAIIHGGATVTQGEPTVTGADGAVLSGFTITGGDVGIWCDGTSPIIKRNIVRNNYGDGGIFCQNGCMATIENNTILGNLGNSSLGMSVGLYVENAAPDIRNNIITGNDTGYLRFQGTPTEDYNNIWGNRENFGNSIAPGANTLSVDPMFQETTVDDYRLHADSPVRNMGDPTSRYQDADGSRNDMGAFDGNGGYLVSLPAQEYFIESILGAQDDGDILSLNGMSRFTANPVFWFDQTGQGTQGEQDARFWISDAISTLTNNQYQAVFLTDTNAPSDLCSVITITFDSPRGETYRAGYDCADPFALNADNMTVSQAAEEAGAAITGGELHLSTASLSGIVEGNQLMDTLIHELGHVGGLQHSYRGETAIMAQGGSGCCQGDYSDIEKEAFALLYEYSTGTTFQTLIQDNKLTYTAVHPFPHIETIKQANVGGGLETIVKARRGETIILKGSRLSLRWSTEGRISARPTHYEEERPVVYFGNDAVRPELDDANQTKYAGSPTRYLQVTIPDTATSGWVFVKSRGLESNPIYLEIEL